MAYTNELTETPDPSKLRHFVNGSNSVAIAAKLFVTGSYDAATIPAAVSDPIIGLTREAIAASARGRGTALAGLMIVTAGTGGLTKGQRVMPEAGTGKAIAWSAAGGSNATICGIAQTTAAADADALVELGGAALGQG